MSNGSLPPMNPADVMQMIQQQQQPQPEQMPSTLASEMMQPQTPMVTGSFDQNEPMTMAAMTGMPVEQLMQLLEMLYGSQGQQGISGSPAAENQLENIDMAQGMMQQYDPYAIQQMQNPAAMPFGYGGQDMDMGQM